LSASIHHLITGVTNKAILCFDLIENKTYTMSIRKLIPIFYPKNKALALNLAQMVKMKKYSQ
jgi:hypothetical protein